MTGSAVKGTECLCCVKVNWMEECVAVPEKGTPALEETPINVPLMSDAQTRVADFTKDADLSWVVTLLVKYRDEILSRWLDAASDQTFHKSRSQRAVADHVPHLFDALVALLQRRAAPERNPGVPLEDPAVFLAAEQHASVRFNQGFNAPDIAVEFRLLRQEIGRALRQYVSDAAPTGDVIAAELLVHDALDGAIFLALTKLDAHEVARQSAEAKLHASEERFKLLVESVSDYAIYTLTPEGCIDSWNTGAQRFLGYKTETAIGTSYENLFTTSDIAKGIPEKLLEQAASDGSVRSDGVRKRADGSLFSAEAELTALRDTQGKVVGFVTIMHDVTAKRDAETEKAAFFATLGHDLKNPLTSALGIAQLLRRQMGKGPVEPAKITERMLILESALRRAALRVDELRDLAKREAQSEDTLQREEFDIVTLVKETVAGYLQSGNGHTVLVKTSPESIVGQWDHDRIERSFDNLLTNAVKFSPADSTIKVSVVQEDVAGALWVKLSVQDEGVGIPKEEIASIFDRFQRGSNVTNVPGSGLGLWSVARIASQHGGSVQVTSEPGQGSTFTLRLPVRA